jgi:ATP-dependent helicase/DNAse subunit B
VFKELADHMAEITTQEECRKRARDITENLVKKPPYAALADSLAGKYGATKLVDEVVEVSCGVYDQIVNSSFSVNKTETGCNIELDNGITLYGKIDRVDTYGDMVRIIDYKTGSIDAKPEKYYMGLKLQLPLYLTAAAKGKRGVGAYYFPAQLNFLKEDEEGAAFRMEGFTDSDPAVLLASDKHFTPDGKNQKSGYINATYNGRKSASNMEGETFADFLSYALMAARQGSAEMLGGFVKPSPAKGVCEYCSMGGSCGFLNGLDGKERNETSVSCAKIAEIVQVEKGDKE